MTNFRRWAELWNARLLGKEMNENHDTGFLNYYTSVLAYRQTKEVKYRDGGFGRRASEGTLQSDDRVGSRVARQW